jgi:hypothetical protein
MIAPIPMRTVSSKASKLLLPLSCFSRRSLRRVTSARTRDEEAEEAEDGTLSLEEKEGVGGDDDAGIDISQRKDKYKVNLESLID